MGHTEAMTEQEAEAWAARLTRIWGPFTNALKVSQWNCDDKQFEFVRFVIRKVCLTYEGNRDGPIRIELESRRAKVSLEWEQGRIDSYDTSSWDENETLNNGKIEDIYDFEAKWLEFFRRGCWLSGCPIEASAHEKAEWIQGFSREELESWNLKI